MNLPAVLLVFVAMALCPTFSLMGGFGSKMASSMECPKLPPVMMNEKIQVADVCLG
jgi:hypothetical protein